MTCRSTRAITQELLTQRDMLNTINRKITEGFKAMTEAAGATQADIDALTDSVNTDRTAIATVVAELNALIAAGQPVQVAALQAAVAGLTSDITADAPPAPPAPTA